MENIGTKILIGVIALFGIGLAYYFFVVKPEQEAANINNIVGSNNVNGNNNGNGNSNGETNPPVVELERFCAPKNWRTLTGGWSCFPILERNGKSFVLESVSNTPATACCYVEGSGDGGSGGGNGGGNGDDGKGSFGCRLKCDALHPFNKDKRDECKSNC